VAHPPPKAIPMMYLLIFIVAAGFVGFFAWAKKP
jgi:hypothetical protein